MKHLHKLQENTLKILRSHLPNWESTEHHLKSFEILIKVLQSHPSVDLYSEDISLKIFCWRDWVEKQFYIAAQQVQGPLYFLYTVCKLINYFFVISLFWYFIIHSSRKAVDSFNTLTSSLAVSTSSLGTLSGFQITSANSVVNYSSITYHEIPFFQTPVTIITTSEA